jgi:hypothetical protein
MALVGTAFGSAIFAGLVAIGVTRAIEKFGGLIGGVLATLPTTVVPASIGVAASLGLSAGPTVREGELADDLLSLWA